MIFGEMINNVKCYFFFLLYLSNKIVDIAAPDNNAGIISTS